VEAYSLGPEHTVLHIIEHPPKRMEEWSLAANNGQSCGYMDGYCKIAPTVKDFTDNRL